MTTENLALWNRLKRTDPKATKPFKRSGFSGTQIDPTWRYQMLTEAFGPCGTGWGYDIVDTQVHDGIVYIGARIWYVDETGEKRISGVQYGGDVLHKTRKDGPPVPNDEAFKMAVTDAVGKAALLLGLAADVYMGQFDDSKYRADSEALYAAKNNPDLQPGAIAGLEEELKRKLETCEDLDTMELLYRSTKDRIDDIGAVDKAAKHRLIGLFASRKSEIQRRDNEALQREQETVYRSLSASLKIASTVDDLAAFWLDNKALINALPGDLKQALTNDAASHKAALTAPIPNVAAE